MAQRFGSVTVDTQTGSITNLFLRNPDGSLPSQSLTGTNSLNSSVTDTDGRQYESALGTPASITVSRDDRTGAVTSVYLDGIPLTASPSPVVSTVPVGLHPNSIAFTADGQTAYVTNFGGGSVTPVNPATGVPGTPIAVGGNPSGIVVGPNGDLFVANYSGKELLQVDPSSRSVVKSIPVGVSPQWPVITPDGKTLLLPQRRL
jgi:DNA-binding beta-propeller fold protein YncE